MPTIDQVDEVLETITSPGCHIVRLPNGLRLNTLTSSHSLRVRSDRLWFVNAKLPWGGTTEQAIVQLVLWLRGEPHRPIHPCWDCWVAHGVGSAETIRLLEASDYDKGSVCVFCGKPGQTDWWMRGSLVGPCCRDGKCRDKESVG